MGTLKLDIDLERLIFSGLFFGGLRRARAWFVTVRFFELTKFESARTGEFIRALPTPV